MLGVDGERGSLLCLLLVASAVGFAGAESVRRNYAKEEMLLRNCCQAIVMRRAVCGVLQSLSDTI